MFFVSEVPRAQNTKKWCQSVTSILSAMANNCCVFFTHTLECQSVCRHGM